MKLRTAKDVIAVVKSRGLNVRVDRGPPLVTILVRPREVPMALVTDALMNALKAWRLEIIAEIEPECLALLPSLEPKNS